MGIRLGTIIVHVKQSIRSRPLHNHHRSSSSSSSSSAAAAAAAAAANVVPKGHLAVYVGESYIKHRFVVPIWYLKNPLFQDLLKRAEEEYGFDHPMGGLTLPCTKDAFLNVTCHLNA